MRKLFAASAAAIALLLSACTGGGAGGGSKQTPVATDGKITGEITFQTWSLKNDKFTPYFEKLVADFEKEHEGVKINWIDQPGDGYEEKILQQANSNELPDVVNLPETFAYQLAKLGKLTDLKSAAPDSLKDYVEGGLGAYSFDKEGIAGTFGYPWYLGTDLNWWNMKVMEAAGYTKDNLPKSTDEWFEAAKKVAESTGGATPLISSMPDLSAIENAGVEIWDGKKFTFNTDKAAELIDKYKELYAAGAMPAEALNNDYAGNANMFTQNKVGYTTATPSFVSQVTNDAPNLVGDLHATKRFVTPPLFVQGISVSKDSKNPATALAFAQYVTNNANQVEFVKLAQGFMPGTKEANANPESFTGAIDDKTMANAVDLAAAQMGEARGTTAIQFSDDMKQYLGQQIALAIKGDISSKDALDKAVDYCNKAL
ncbi:ABC transporter substrate-binding protein [Bowdeniella nasicola]|uniref:ABC transporter substrate-binding protein n=1 Tax=Bowdeniella nasicola TaxID=208480 RepID=A0A1Q5Q1A9_9ACTO|nr:extracellular solute-binding protein [Bowdeniella nasicola]OKL53628.1 ABC transporter substrate-binding protein [Bowdeniella nasicola]